MRATKKPIKSIEKNSKKEKNNWHRLIPGFEMLIQDKIHKKKSPMIFILHILQLI